MFVRRLGAQRVQRLARCDAEAAALARREAPEAVVAGDLVPALVDDRALGRVEAVTDEEVAVVAAGEEACFLALGPARRGEPGGAGALPRLLLGALAEREPDAVEHARVEAGEHVGLVLRGVGAAGEEQAAPVLAHARVVACGEAGRADPAGEREECGEAEAAVAADAGVGRLSPLVARDEGPDDGAAEALAQVERHVRRAELVTELPGGHDRGRRAAGAFPVGPGGIHPEAKGHTDRLASGVARLQERHGAVHASAHRDRHAVRARAGRDSGAERVVQRVERERLAGNRGGLEQSEAFDLPAQGLRAPSFSVARQRPFRARP